MRDEAEPLKSVNPLRRLRLEAGDPTLREVAALTEKAGHRIDHAALSLLERGKQDVTFKHAEVLSAVYGYPLAALMAEMAEWYEALKKGASNEQRPQRP